MVYWLSNSDITIVASLLLFFCLLYSFKIKIKYGINDINRLVKNDINTAYIGVYIILLYLNITANKTVNIVIMLITKLYTFESISISLSSDDILMYTFFKYLNIFDFLSFCLNKHLLIYLI